MRWRRVAAWSAGALLVGTGLAGLATVGFVGWLRTPAGNTWLQITLTQAVRSSMTAGDFQIDALRTDLLHHLEIDGLRILDASGTELLELDHARARFDLLSLATGPLTVHRLEAVGLDVALDTGPDGRMALASLWGPPSTSTEPFSLPIDLRVHDVWVEGVGVTMDQSVRLGGAVAHGALGSDGPRFDLTGLELCGHLVVPGPTNACVSGPAVWDGSVATLTGMVVELPGTAAVVQGTAGGEALDLSLSLGDLDLGALDPVASRAGIAGTWAGVASVKGPTDDLAITARLAGTATSRGHLSFEGFVRPGATLRWGGDVLATGFHVEDVYPGVGDPVVLDGTIGLDATGVSFPDDLDLGLTYRGHADVFEAYETEDVDVVGRLVGGTLTLERASFLGIAGRLNATGTIDADDGPLDLRVTGAVIPAEIAELGIEGLGGDGTADLRIRGDFKNDPGVFRIGGRVVMAPFSYTSDVAFERLVLDLQGTTRGADVDLVVHAQGTAGTTYGLRMDTLDAPDVAVRMVDKDITAVGPAHLEQVSYPGLGWFATADASYDVALPADAPMRADATVQLGAFDLQTFLGSGGTADVTMDGDQVGFTVALDDGDRAFLRTNGSFDMASQRVELPTLAIAPTVRLGWVAQGPVALTLTEGGVADATLDLRGLHGNVALDGTFGTTGPLDGTVVLRDLQLDALAELFPDDFSGLSGVLSLDASASGSADAAILVGRTELTGLWMEGVTRWLDVRGTFDARDGHVDTALDIGTAGEPLAVLKGRIPVRLDLAAPGPDPNGAVAATLALRPGPLDRLEHVTVDPLGLPPGSIGGVVSMGGRLGDPDLRVAGVVQGPFGGWSEPARVELDVRRAGGGIDGWATVSEGLVERVRVAGGGRTRMQEVFAWALEGGPEPDLGDLEVYLDDMAVSAVLGGVPVDSVARAAGQALDVSGALVGSATVTGSPWRPTLEGGIHWVDGRVGGLALESAHITLMPTEGGLEVDAGLAYADGGMTVQGTVPLALDLREDVSTWAAGTMALHVDGPGVPIALASLVEPGITDARGRVAIVGDIGGTVDDPVPDLEASIVEGAFTYAPVGLRFTDMNGQVGTSKRRLKLSSFAVTTAPVNRIGLVDQGASRVTITGAANLDGAAPTELSARVSLDDAWVMGTYDIGARVAGDLIVSGAWPNLIVRTEEDLEVVQARVSYDSDEALAAGDLETAPGLVIHRGAVAVAGNEPEPPPFYAGFDVDVGVNLGRNVEVLALVPFFDDLGAVTANLTRANVSTRLGGNVDVALDDLGNPLLTGEVDVVDGSVQVVRTSFQLDDGRVVFLGGDLLATTQLDLNASTSVQGTPIDLRISGTADAPNLSTTSPGYDQTQVLLMLLTGRPPGSVAGEQGRAASGEVEALATTAAALVASSVLSGTSAGALTIEPDGAVRVGAPWSSTVFTQFVVRPFADNDENRFSGSLDWSLARRLVLELGAGDRYQWSDLSWEVRF